MKLKDYVLWENDKIRVVIQGKANWPAKYGGHIVVEQKMNISTPYSDYSLYAKMSVIAAAIQKVLEQTGLAPHANLQSNSNWAFRNEDGSFRDIKEGQNHRNLHIHIYGRKKGKDSNWGEPIRPAYWQEQQVEQKYWGQIWNKKQINKLTDFLNEEIPKALKKI